jgi:peptidoglycan hydrolase-like protein with peptidoglycan-binding domain
MATIHANAVVHEPGRMQLTHSGIDNRKTGGALTPASERSRVVVPHHGAETLIKILIKHMRKMPQNREVKLPADDFIYKRVNISPRSGCTRTNPSRFKDYRQAAARSGEATSHAGSPCARLGNGARRPVRVEFGSQTLWCHGCAQRGVAHRRSWVSASEHTLSEPPHVL